jgi:segregation and condensation protein A
MSTSMETPAADGGVRPAAFEVKLANFEGPFDLLLQLIGKHKLDVTEVALSVVTDDFIAHIRRNLTGDAGSTGGDDGKGSAGRQGDSRLGEYDLDETTEFLLVAATLLDLKAARLLPCGEVEDEADLDLLDARDLLFARLLQYRAFKHVAVMFAELEAAALRSYPRSVSLESRYEDLLPEVMIGVDAESFAQIAAAAFMPRPVPTVATEHLHQVMVSVPEQVGNLMALLERRGVGQWATFSELVADCGAPIEIVGRFLALLELYRARAVAFDQSEPLGALQISWTGERPNNGHLATTEAVEEDADD